MTKDEVAQLIQRWESFWASRNPSGLASMYAEHCRVNSPIFGELKGASAIEDSNRRLFTVFPDWDMKTESVIIDGDRVAQVFKVTATHQGEFMGLPGTGRKAQIHGVRIMTLADGKIVDELRLYDFTLLLMQVGVLRGKPGH